MGKSRRPERATPTAIAVSLSPGKREEKQKPTADPDEVPLLAWSPGRKDASLSGEIRSTERWTSSTRPDRIVATLFFSSPPSRSAETNPVSVLGWSRRQILICQFLNASRYDSVRAVCIRPYLPSAKAKACLLHLHSPDQSWWCRRYS